MPLVESLYGKTAAALCKLQHFALNAVQGVGAVFRLRNRTFLSLLLPFRR
jgi:hypothetical protein